MYRETVAASFDEVAARVEKAVYNSGSSTECVNTSSCIIEGVRVETRVYDKFFYRVSSRVSLSLTMVGDQYKTHVVAIGSGGGAGLCSISYGSEESIIQPVIDALSVFPKWTDGPDPGPGGPPPNLPR